MNPQDLIDKALELMNQHLEQLRVSSTVITKDGLKGLSAYDSQVIERYTKLLFTMTKRTTADGLDDLTDEQLQAILNESDDNVHPESGETE